jgi:hypothetical protein
MNEIEEKLWNYIDGTCTPNEQAAITQLIATNDVYQKKYAELLQLNADFTNIELDEPSMAFTYNVMETIRAETALKPLKSAINKWVIWGISAFFLVTICTLLIFVLASTNWQQSGHVSANLPQFSMPSIQQYINSNVIRGFLMFDMVLALYVLDGYLRKKLNNKQAQ